MKSNLILMTLSGLVAATSVVHIASAQTASPAKDMGDSAEVAAFLKAPTDMTAALRAAEAKLGGTAVAAEFDEKDGRAFYEVDLVVNGKVVSAEVDPANGAVGTARPEGTLANEAKKDADYVDPAALPMPLVDAVAKAEASGGKVMAIGVEKQGERTVLEVETAATDGKTSLHAMGADGKLTAIEDDDDGDKAGKGEAAEEGEHGEEGEAGEDADG